MKKKISYNNSISFSPSTAYLISSHPLETKTLQSRFSIHPNLKDLKIKIIDGHKLVEMFKTHRQDLIEKLIGGTIETVKNIKFKYDNSITMKAIGHHENVNLNTIYTDIDISLGRRTVSIRRTTYFLIHE